jgi:D-tyrosyl-tRNA(Tyr) deacylase
LLNLWALEPINITYRYKSGFLRPLLKLKLLSDVSGSGDSNVIGLIQRVSRATVSIDSDDHGTIGNGLLALVGIQKNDSEKQADRLLERLLGYRVFADAQDRMNLSLTDVSGGLLLVPQFTLAANTRKGMRASFTGAAAGEAGRALFDYLVATARDKHPTVASGVFGAHMQVSLVNDGPVTFWLES